MITNAALQHFTTEWNFKHSPGSFNEMIRDLEKGKIKSETLTPLQKFEASERLKNAD